MLLNIKPLLEKAKKGKYAVGHFNILNLEWAKTILLTAKETRTPVILGVSEAPVPYMGGFIAIRYMVEGLIKSLDIDVPVALHLDHGSFDGALKAVDAGFTSVMFDGSKLSLDENIKKTIELVKLAHSKDISVEAEVGAVGGEEDGVIGNGELADPNECKKFVDTGIDVLAAGIGNIHGKHPSNWKGLNFETLKAIKEKVGDIPLVLHGGSGIPKDMIRKAIELGVCKVNVNTELHIAFCDATRKYFEEGKDKIGKGYDIRNITAGGIKGISDTVKEKMELFGSLGKA